MGGVGANGPRAHQKPNEFNLLKLNLSEKDTGKTLENGLNKIIENISWKVPLLHPKMSFETDLEQKHGNPKNNV